MLYGQLMLVWVSQPYFSFSSTESRFSISRKRERRLHQENLMKEKRELKKEKRRTIMKK